MPTLVINNVPARLYDQIERLAQARKRTAADTALELLQTAISANGPVHVEAPVRNEIYLTEEIVAPFTLPRPEGTLVRAVQVPPPLPSPHDIPEEG